MKKNLAAALLAIVATGATAGGYDAPADPPLMPPVVIADEAAASSAPSAALVLGLATLVVFGTAALN